MIQQVYCLRDVKANLFGRPVFVVNLGSLVRELQDALQGDDTLGRHPEDFSLFHFGSFDDVAGDFNLFHDRLFVLEVASLKKPVSPSLSPVGAFSSEV